MPVRLGETPSSEFPAPMSVSTSLTAGRRLSWWEMGNDSGTRYRRLDNFHLHHVLNSLIPRYCFVREKLAEFHCAYDT